MPASFDSRLQFLASSDGLALVAGIRRGIEKEALRVDSRGQLALSPHPRSLGSALTHPSITTDFSEALLEFITGIHGDIDGALDELADIHRFASRSLPDNEGLWFASMPCVLPEDSRIPLARYGTANVATMKTVYRSGLGWRYGRSMQTIAGIHYNFSLPEALWPALAEREGHRGELRDFITERYFGLIRNFRRLSWLLIYLFGASPALGSSFLAGRSHDLEQLDRHTLYRPWATSLRMGDLGYQSSAQSSLPICYNSVDNYIDTLLRAITDEHPAYREIGVKIDGQYRQLSTGLLQIENEFYSPIRPKRVTASGEIPLGALRRRGVEYIEVRCLDINPWLPLGIDAETTRFLDAFLLYCLLAESPLCDDSVRVEIGDNLGEVVNRGRQPGLTLQREGEAVGLADWAGELLDGVESVAALLDTAHGNDLHRRSCAEQRRRVENAALTPSARILEELRDQPCSWAEFAQHKSREHGAQLASDPLADARLRAFERDVATSLQTQAEMERSDETDFDSYLTAYFDQYRAL